MSGEKPAPTAAEIAEAREMLNLFANIIYPPIAGQWVLTLLAALDAATQEKEARFDCHAGPGTTTPACGGCTTCLTRALDAAEARATAAEERTESVHASWSKCLKLLATAERERDEARAAGRKEILDKCRQRFPNSTFYLKWEEDAVLAALKEASRG